ncbi:hypothetical protein BGZ70_000243 [Mortierella alpina]|uniref:Transcription activator GCR1-like domain-containing protein n=1 Tax=Mortierella alpina TaxID=64518 RepID=A0A9P6IY84_MORAP|nr:hypothetical protein BGZ70_000243 [Mortierella alpina]
MEHHARHVWRHWCEGGHFSDGHVVTLEKVIEFIDTEVLPKEEDILRQRMERTIAPVSGIESRILPVLQLWKKQERRKYDRRQAPHRNQFNEPLASISPPLGPNTVIMPGALAAVPAKVSPSGSVPTKSKTSTVPMTIILDSDDEKDGEVAQNYLAPSVLRDRETAAADLEFLRNSLAKVQEISRMIGSLCGDLKENASKSSDHFSTSMFSRLQSAQQQAKGLGLETTLCEPLLLRVLEEHMRIVHDLNVKVASNDIIIVSKNTGPATALNIPESARKSSPNMHPKAKEEQTIPNTGDQDDMTLDTGHMDWEADAGFAETVTCPKASSIAKSVLAALDDGPDDIPEMELFNKTTDEESKAEDGGDSTFKYEIIRGDKSVRHVWEQWTVGVDGNPSIQRLEELYGTRWRMAKDANYLNQSRCIVREIARLVTDKGMTEEQAIQSLQDQLGNRAIGSLAIRLFKENNYRRKGKDRRVRRTSAMLRENGPVTSSATPPLTEAPPLPDAPALPEARSLSEDPPLTGKQTPTEVWEDLVHNSRLMDLKFFTPSPSAMKRHKSTAPKTPTRTKEASETPTPSQASPTTDAHSANLLPTTTAATIIPANTALKAHGVDATPSTAAPLLKSPIAQTPTLTPTPASSTVSGTVSAESLPAQPPLSQPPTPAAPAVASRTYKTAVEDARRDVGAMDQSALARTSPTLDSKRVQANEPLTAQDTNANTATTPATTQPLENTPAATVQAPSQTSTQVTHSTHPRTRAGSQAQSTTTPRPPLKSPEAPSNNALALVYANALLTRFMASSMTQDPSPSSKGATGNPSTTTVTTVTEATATMSLVSSTGPDHPQGSDMTATSLPSALTTSTPITSASTLAPVSASAASPASATTLASVPVPASTGGATVAPTVRTRSSNRKASTPAPMSETNSNRSMSPVSAPTTVVSTAASTAVPSTASTTAPNTTPTTVQPPAPASAPAAGPITLSTAAPGAAVATGPMASSPFQYRMNKNNSTVFDIWTEWMEGVNGGPSISSMNRRYGDLSWLPVEERELYRDQRMVLVEAEKLVRLRGMQVKQALEELERTRVTLNVDIKVFGKVLAESMTA